MWALESDLWIGKVELSPELIEKGIIENIGSIIDLSVTFGQKLIISSILPTNMPLNPKNRERNELVISVNNRLKIISNDNNLIYIDYHAHMTDNGGKTLADGLSTDGLHPHVCGYNIMASVLKNTLKSYDIDI
jgi:lysophospholipase L1-like esterase